LLDEAQDTGGVVLDLMRHQAAQLICVGDKYQSLYEWRGAKNAMVELPATVERRLTTSFRFGPAIADYASQILALMGETAPLLGNPDRDSVVGPVAPQALLCRTNIRLIERLFDCLAADEKPAVVGGVDEILSYITAAEQLMAGKAVDRPIDFFGFADWNEVEATAQSEPGAEELRKWTSLFKKYKTDVLRKALSHLPRESAADVVLSTGHKSKGREWDTVRLEPDFLRGMPAGDDNEGWRKFELEALSGRGLDHVAAELRLFYVAATRGQTGLEVNKKLISKMERLQKIANCKVAPAEVAA
jgi:superfamily I DNA/RNA helicase